MVENVYDDADFFAAYSRLPRSVEGLDGAPEWPVLRAMLPDPAGGRVLDLVCGFGWFCRWVTASGAHSVLGVDRFTSPSHPAFVEGPNQDRVWPLDGYLREGPRSADWLGSRVDKHHRTIGTYVGALRDAGFRLDELVEWGPSEEQVAAVPAWAAELERPMFLLVSAARDEPR